MNREFRFAIIAIALFSLCGTASQAHANPWQKHWKKALGSYKGCFALYDLKAKKYAFVSNQKACQARFAPCSTFKIPNALIALQLGNVRSLKQVFRWDGKKRFAASWNRSHNLTTAMRYSVLWVFQGLAQKAGLKTMRQWVKKLHYGNQKTSQRVRRFWLDGSLRISPLEQIRFLEKLYTNQLPFRKELQAKVRKILRYKTLKGGIVSGKTGSDYDSKKKRWTLGWFVGHYQRGNKTYLFVTQVHKGPKPSGMLARKLSMQLLQHIR